MGLLSFPLSVGAGSSIRFQREDGSEAELLSLPKKQMQQLRGKEISMIFQEPMTALDPMYTIEDQIVESLPLSHRSQPLRHAGGRFGNAPQGQDPPGRRRS